MIRAVTLGVVGVALVGVSASAAFGGGVVSLDGGVGPAWSRDGSLIVYVGPARLSGGGLGGVIVMAADGSGRRVVASGPAGSSVSEVRWAAGGRVVYQVWDEGLLRSVARGSGRVVRLGSVGLLPNPAESFVVSADGRRVAFTSPCGCELPLAYAVRVVSASGGAARTLPRPAKASDKEASFSPDGSRVVFARSFFSKPDREFESRSSLVIESARGGVVRPLHVLGEWPAWSPDGRWIAYQGANDQLDLISASGGSARALVPGFPAAEGVVAFSWSPDSTRLAYISRRKIGIVDLSGNVSTFSIPGLRPGIQTPQWSPDGASIAFTGTGLSNAYDLGVYVVGADGSGLHRLT